MTLLASLRPTEPLSAKPAGYVELATYSSLARLWTYLASAQRQGRTVSVVRGDTERVCRRRLGGYTLQNAGLLIDEAKLKSELDAGLSPHPALLALLGGDSAPLRALLSAEYRLHTTFVLAFTQRRELVVRPEFRYLPLQAPAPLPGDVRLAPRRMGRDELRFLLDRACGL